MKECYADYIKASNRMNEGYADNIKASNRKEKTQNIERPTRCLTTFVKIRGGLQ